MSKIKVFSLRINYKFRHTMSVIAGFERNQSQTQQQESNVLTINSTIISGAGAIPALAPLL
ncbi:MAG: hypothetical protein E7A34_12465, partial [Leclercia adecarboxylata]|nr:hypothetical protein [Leclercia adecarboxylata]